MNGIESDLFDLNDKIDETPELIPNQIPQNPGLQNYLFQQNNKMFHYQNGQAFQVNMNDMSGSYEPYPFFDGQNIQMLDPNTGNFQFIYNQSMPFHPDLQYVVNKGDFPYMNTPYFGTDVHGNFFTLMNEGGQFSGKGNMNGMMGENGMSGFFF